jgi:DNA-directed RNA polymerase specialized sigma24 family protein
MVDLDVHLVSIVAGDPDAFGLWTSEAERSLRESLRSFATRVDIEAVVQEALLRAWNIAPRVERDGAPNSLLRVTLRIARNLAIDEVRRARAVAAGDDDHDASLRFATFEAMPDPLLREAIHACSERLSGKPKRALLARIASQGAEHDGTIAARLGMQLNTFLQNFTRARKLLADCLRRRGVDLAGLI